MLKAVLPKLDGHVWKMADKCHQYLEVALFVRAMFWDLEKQQSSRNKHISLTYMVAWELWNPQFEYAQSICPAVQRVIGLYTTHHFVPVVLFVDKVCNTTWKS